MTKLAKAFRLFEKNGMSVLAVNQELHIDRSVLRREFARRYGAETFERMWRERQGKWYNRATLKAIEADVEADVLGLKEIVKKYRTHTTVLYRNLRRFYGDERFEEIVAHYKNKQGFRKGSRVGEKYWFKKGAPLRWVNARRWRPIGAIQYKKYRYGPRKKKFYTVKFIKVSDVPNGNNWMTYSRYLWVQEHGLIPEGKRVIHLDNDRENDDLDNLAVMSRSEHAQYRDARFPKLLEQRKRRLVLAVKRRCRVPTRCVKRWECAGCAAEFSQELERCPKCGGHSIELIRVKCA